MKKVIIFIGPPGSGKGTQAKKIAEKYNYGHISTGDLLRDFSKNAETLAADEKLALQKMKEGKLVPDWLIYRLAFKAADALLENGQGVVFDGAIRTVAQARSYQTYFANQALNKEVVVIDITMPDDESFNRLANRRVCEQCGMIVPVIADDEITVCPKCGGNLVARPDDNPEIVRKRLVEQGNSALEPIRQYYKELQILKEIDGMQTIEAVEKEIEEVLNA